MPGHHQADRAGWAIDVLLSGVSAVIDAHPGIRAGDLCAMVGQEKMPFKLNVRKLKALGLTDSLEVGVSFVTAREELVAPSQGEGE